MQRLGGGLGFEIEYSPRARVELLQEMEYLEGQEADLGLRFGSVVKQAEELLLQFPQADRSIEPHVRRYPVNTFPYSLIYSLREDNILILAVAHHSRRPGYWRNRL